MGFSLQYGWAVLWAGNDGGGGGLILGAELNMDGIYTDKKFGSGPLGCLVVGTLLTFVNKILEKIGRSYSSSKTSSHSSLYTL